jgi:phosphate transport system permease protein
MYLLILALISVLIFSLLLNRNIKTVRQNSDKKKRFNSLPLHYAYCYALWTVLCVIIVYTAPLPSLAKWIFAPVFILANFWLIKKFYQKNFNAKNHFESVATAGLAGVTGIGILITVIITASILFESIRFFEMVNPLEFLFGTSWNPQMAMTTEQEVGKSAFGIVPVFLGTLLITLIAMLVSVPLGIMGAIYLCLYAKARSRDYLKPVLEILAGVPTVVYGYFAVIFVAPLFKDIFALIGVDIASESALAAGFVMGVMIIPFVLSLTDDALNAVPQAMKDGALAMGSTKSEMIKKVVLPSAMPSIVGAVILAVSRAIGETMIVVMAAGLVAKLTFNPLDSVTTATAQIVTLLVGDQEFNSPKTLAAFALALTLFIFTFIFNIVALIVIKNYKKKYG